jgi:hypothetical protein
MNTLAGQVNKRAGSLEERTSPRFTGALALFTSKVLHGMRPDKLLGVLVLPWFRTGDIYELEGLHGVWDVL